MTPFWQNNGIVKLTSENEGYYSHLAWREWSS